MLPHPIADIDRESRVAQIHQPVAGITVWIDGGIHIKTRDSRGDPIEMSEEEALTLAALLQQLVAEERGQVG